MWQGAVIIERGGTRMRDVDQVGRTFTLQTKNQFLRRTTQHLEGQPDGQREEGTRKRKAPPNVKISFVHSPIHAVVKAAP
jgi:hypothetical protein